MAWFPPQRGGQVEAESVHAVGLNPPAQAVHDHLHDVRIAHVEGVATAAGIEMAAVMVQGVPGRMVQAAPGQGGSQGVAFRAVVVDHVENDLDAVPVQRVDHGSELGTHAGVVGIAPTGGDAGVTRIGHEEGQGVVAPMVRHAPLDQVVLVDVQVHRQQAQGRDAQALEMRQHRRAGQAGVAATLFSRNRRVQHGQRLDVGLVQHGACHWRLRAGHDRRAGAQFLRDVDDPAARHALGVVMGAGLVWGAGAVTDLVGQPCQRA